MRKAPLGDPGSAGHPPGAGVFGCAVNFPGRSFLAVDGGFPLVFAGASAHQATSPENILTATRPCAGSSRV